MSGYFVSIDFDGSPSLTLVRLDAGVAGDDVTGQTLNYNQANSYILEVECTGSTFVGRVYEKVGDTVTLFDEVTATDGTYTAGPTGLLVAQDNFPQSTVPGDATFDNFFATDGVVAQPKLVNTTNGDGNLTFGVEGEPGREYTVEYKSDVANGSWSTLTTLPASPFTDPQSVIDPANQPGRIYRASTPED